MGFTCGDASEAGMTTVWGVFDVGSAGFNGGSGF